MDSVVQRLLRPQCASGGRPPGQAPLVHKAVGAKLRSIRRQWKLSLREVEERSIRLARERGSPSYQISASWLHRLEREEHELTVNKLIALANVYNLPTERLLHAIYPENTPQTGLIEPLSSPNATLLLTEGPLGAYAKRFLPDTLATEQPPDETTLLSLNPQLPAPYRRGIIGKRDLTLDPMIPAGSLVHIDTQRRAISPRKNWTHEFKRPIYFLMTRDGYVCGWCELDRASEWLTLIPHPLSPPSSKRWKFRKEVENLGRVVFVAIRLNE